MEANKERITLLLNALRGKEFQQTKNRLRVADSNKMCCLGVACEVYRRETGTGTWLASGAFTVGDRYADSDLPTLVKDWYGFEDNNPDLTFDEDDNTCGAVNANDILGYNFTQIADAFERTFLKDN